MAPPAPRTPSPAPLGRNPYIARLPGPVGERIGQLRAVPHCKTADSFGRVAKIYVDPKDNE